jgi:uncharacterized membrane protein YgcG
MLRPVKIVVATMAVTAVLAGVAYAATRPIPQQQPGVALQNPSNLALPGDVKGLEAALAADGPVQYKVLVIDSTDGEDLTAYLDRVAAEWQQPAQDTLLLVIYTQENYNLRFYMGPGFRAKGVTVDEMLSLVRAQYFATKSAKGDVAGGLVNLIGAVNQRMSGAAEAGAGAGQVPQTGAVANPAKISVPDYIGRGPRSTAVDQLRVGKELLTAYLNVYKTEAVDEASRLQELRLNDNNINVVSGSNTDMLVFQVTYDVLPATGATNWFAGNGQAGEGGWIVGKTQFMAVTREGNEWVLQQLSTSP